MERDPQTYGIIGAAIEVHHTLGPGYLEAVYQEALEIELSLRGVPHQSQPRLRLQYKGRTLRKYYQPDLVAWGRVVVEIKAQSALISVDVAQIINSLKCASRDIGLLINFGQPSLEWKRFANTI